MIILKYKEEKEIMSYRFFIVYEFSNACCKKINVLPQSFLGEVESCSVKDKWSSAVELYSFPSHKIWSYFDDNIRTAKVDKSKTMMTTP